MIYLYSNNINIVNKRIRALDKVTCNQRRVLKICNLFVFNYAYFKSGWDQNKFKGSNDFWISLNNNFYDICILEWCKLFGSNSETLHWKKIVFNKKDFKLRLFRDLNITQEDLNLLHETTKVLRDKFIAHIDNDKYLYRPNLGLALKIIYYLYKEIFNLCSDTNGFPEDLEAIYELNFKLGNVEYCKSNN